MEEQIVFTEVFFFLDFLEYSKLPTKEKYNNFTT